VVTETPDDVHGRALRDPAFRARVAAAYTGRHDILDALWWRDHPMSPTPEGTPSPAADLTSLRADVFGRPADPAPTPAPAPASSRAAHPSGDPSTAATDAAARRLEALERELADDRRAIDAAVESATALPGETLGSTPQATGPRSAERRPAHGLADDPGDAAADADDSDSSPAAADTPPRRRALLIGGAAVLLGALIGAGVVVATVGVADGTVAAGGSSTSATAESEAAAGSTVDSPAAIRVFDREQVPSDLPPTLRNVRLRETTIRPLGPSGTGWLYAARDVDDQVCLVLVQPSGLYSASCVPQERFPADGILLRASFATADSAEQTAAPSAPGAPGADAQSPDVPFPDVPFTDVEVRWLPDGSVRGERTSR
jgi:hypothetical protein